MKYPPREVEVLEALDHPHINRLYDKVVLADRVHLILEHIEGRELCDIVEKHTIPEDTVRELWRQMLLAVEYMHGAGLVHRCVSLRTIAHTRALSHRIDAHTVNLGSHNDSDLKLENMLVDINGNLKIIDMGFGNFFKPGELLGTFCGRYARSTCYLPVSLNDLVKLTHEIDDCRVALIMQHQSSSRASRTRHRRSTFGRLVSCCTRRCQVACRSPIRHLFAQDAIRSLMPSRRVRTARVHQHMRRVFLLPSH